MSEITDFCAALKTDLRLDIVAYISSRESCTVRDVAKRFFSDTDELMIVRRQLRALLDAGICTVLTVGRVKYYSINHERCSNFIRDIEKIMSTTGIV